MLGSLRVQRDKSKLQPRACIVGSHVQNRRKLCKLIPAWGVFRVPTGTGKVTLGQGLRG